MNHQEEGREAVMTGTQKIVERILEEARQAGDASLAEAERKAGELLADTERQAAEEAAAMQTDAARRADQIRHAAESAATLSIRNALLRQRREELDKTLSETLAYLNGLPDPAYFDGLFSLIRRYAQAGEGLLWLNETDRGRLPADFSDRLKQAGISLQLADAARPMDGGCVLQYGDIEVNLSFSALLEEQRELLEDRIRRELWDD